VEINIALKYSMNVTESVFMKIANDLRVVNQACSPGSSMEICCTRHTAVLPTATFEMRKRLLSLPGKAEQ
jgi:hypothetical protein